MSYAEELLKLINTARQKEGLPSLSFNLSLMRAARGHSAHMLQSGHFSHLGKDKSTFFERINSAEYLYLEAAENIAFCPVNATRVFHIWMNSKPHRRSILRPATVHVGVAVAPEHKLKSRDNHYWTLKLAAPLHFESMKENA